MPVYSACGPGHLGASQTYIGPPVDRPFSDSLPCPVSESEPQFPMSSWVMIPKDRFGKEREARSHPLNPVSWVQALAD